MEFGFCELAWLVVSVRVLLYKYIFLFFSLFKFLNGANFRNALVLFFSLAMYSPKGTISLHLQYNITFAVSSFASYCKQWSYLSRPIRCLCVRAQMVK